MKKLGCAAELEDVSPWEIEPIIADMDRQNKQEQGISQQPSAEQDIAQQPLTEDKPEEQPLEASYGTFKEIVESPLR